MGRTLSDWIDHVRRLVRDEAGRDVSESVAQEVGVRTALSQFSTDRPRELVVDVSVSGAIAGLPSPVQGWVDGFSSVTRVEAPAGLVPPARVSWEMTRSPADPAVSAIHLPGSGASSARVWFTSLWPMPGAVAADDAVPAPAFGPVVSLAAAFVLVSLSTEAARSLHGALPTDFVGGEDRSRDLLDAAAAMRVVYNTFVGLGQLGAGAVEQADRRRIRSVRLVRP